MSVKVLGQDTPNSLMSLSKGAAYLGIGQNAIYEFVRAGKIAVVSLPGRVQKRVTRAALDAFRDAHTGTIAGDVENVSQETPTRLTSEREDEVFERRGVSVAAARKEPIQKSRGRVIKNKKGAWMKRYPTQD